MPAPKTRGHLNPRTVEGKLHSALHYLEMVPRELQEFTDLRNSIEWLIAAVEQMRAEQSKEGGGEHRDCFWRQIRIVFVPRDERRATPPAKPGEP